MLTYRGICYNLELSPYEVIINYGDDEIVYKFSSEMYKTKFLERIEEEREDIKNSLSKRFGLSFEVDVVSDLRLYSKIEKRGFYVKNKLEVFNCLNNIKFVGQNVIQKS